MQYKIKIAGTDYASSVIEKSILIESVITRRIDTCKLIVKDTTGSIVISPKEEIIISNLAESVRYFAGCIASVDIKVEGITKLFVCQAQDYTILADKRIVNEVYEDKTDAYIFNDLCTKYRADLDGTTYVQTGLTHTRIVFNRLTLREAFDKLALESGFDWYVDYNKKVHYFAADTNIASFGLSDDPDEATTYPYSGLKYNKDATRIVNLVLVIGGTYMSDDVSFELAGDAQATELLMPYKMHPAVGESALLVYYNNNTDGAPDWVAYTVGVDFIDTFNAINCLHNYQEKLLKFSAAPPDRKRSVKVTGRYDVPILVRVRQETSYAQYGEWYEEKIVNKDIDNTAWAKLEGKAVLAEHAFEKERGHLQCIQDGLTSGETAYIVNSIQGIDGYYLINKLVTRLLGGTVAQYTVSFGEYNPDLVDLIITTKALATQHQERREDEVLIELLERFEELALVEAPTRWEQAKGQYCWAPKSNGAGLREAKWDFFTWG